MIEQLEFKITKEDFLESGWKEAVNEAQPDVIEFYFSIINSKVKGRRQCK